MSADLFNSIISEGQIRDDRDKRVNMKPTREFKFGYVYGYLACYHEQTDCDLEDFVNQLNQVCSCELTLDMLASLMEIISIEPEIEGKYVKVSDSEVTFYVRLDDNNEAEICNEPEKPWCYAEDKKAVCNCIQPCEPPSDDEDDEEKVCEDCGCFMASDEDKSYAVGCLTVYCCDECYEIWKKSQEPEEE